MKKRDKYVKLACGIFACAFILTGCSGNHGTEERIFAEEETEAPEEEKMEEQEAESGSVSAETDTEDYAESMVMEPETVYVDWSEYFNGLNGAAVVYDAADRRYTIRRR